MLQTVLSTIERIMDQTMVSVPVVSPASFLQAKQRAKLDIQEDMRLDKAASLTAQRNVLLTSPAIPPDLKVAQLKDLNRQVNYWTHRVRRPLGEADTGVGDPNDDDADAGPTQQMVSALLKTIKKTSTPANVKPPPPRTPHTVKPSKKRRAWDYLTPKPTPPTRPAKLKAKEQLQRRRLPTPALKTPKAGPSGASGGRPSTVPQDSTKKRLFDSAKKQGLKQATKGAERLAKKWLKL